MVHIHLQLTNCRFAVVEEGAHLSSFFCLNEKTVNDFTATIFHWVMIFYCVGRLLLWRIKVTKILVRQKVHPCDLYLTATSMSPVTIVMYGWEFHGRGGTMRSVGYFSFWKERSKGRSWISSMIHGYTCLKIDDIAYAANNGLNPFLRNNLRYMLELRSAGKCASMLKSKGKYSGFCDSETNRSSSNIFRLKS